MKQATQLGRARGWIALALGMPLLGCTVFVAPTCMAVLGLDGGHDEDEAHGEDGGPRASAEPACPGAQHRTGSTECFPGECGPGQYCDDRSLPSVCHPGCTSDANCGADDTCVRVGDAAIGRCEPCREQTRRDEDVCVTTQRTGSTPCFPGRCGPGQYCVDTGLSHCEPGCVSNENCAPTERCERTTDGALGVCRSCTFEPVAGR
jgi:hypothetical protein